MKHAYFIVRGEFEHQMLFDSVVARKIWFVFSYVVTVSLGSNFESIAKCWLSNEKVYVWLMWLVQKSFWGYGIQKWHVLSQRRMEKYAGSMEENHSNGEKLQDFMSSATRSQCSWQVGGTVGKTRGNGMMGFSNLVKNSRILCHQRHRYLVLSFA